MYQPEEKETREQFQVVYWDCSEAIPVIASIYIWAYTQEEANQVVLDNGFKLV